MRADNLTICYWCQFLCICPVIDNEFRHNIVKVVYGSTPLSPRGSTATLTMLWQNSCSITGQTHKKLMLICDVMSHPIFLVICSPVHITEKQSNVVHYFFRCAPYLLRKATVYDLVYTICWKKRSLNLFLCFLNNQKIYTYSTCSVFMYLWYLYL